MSAVGKSQLIFLSLVSKFFLVLSVVSSIFSPFVASRLTPFTPAQRYHPDDPDHTSRTTAPGFQPFTKSSVWFSADTSVQLKAIWTWLSFFSCSLGPTSTLETKTTSLHFLVKCSNCFPVHVVHYTSVVIFRAGIVS